MDELNVSYSTTQYIVVGLGNENYGIDIRFIDNIVRMQRITRIPKVQNEIKGVINLRGEVIPVVSVRIKMSLPEDEITDDTRIIIVKLDSGDCIGIIVDNVREVVTLNESQVEKQSYDSKSGKTSFISGIGKHNNELISLLDMNLVFAEKERDKEKENA